MSELYETPALLAFHQYNNKLEQGVAMERLDTILCELSSDVAAYRAKEVGKFLSASARGQLPGKAIRFAITHHGVVISQKMFPQQMVEAYDYLYQLQGLVPDKFFNRAIFERILNGVREHVNTLNVQGETQRSRLAKELGVKDFMDIKIERSYSVHHDKPKETKVTGSW